MKRLLIGIAAAMMATVAMAGSTIPLSINQATAFHTLGRSCGGVKIQEFASGFDSSGLPTADVLFSTRCGGSGRGGGYHTYTYEVWAKVTWDLGGVLVSVEHEPQPDSVDLTAVFTNGDYSEHTQTGTFSLVPGNPYVYSTAILETP